MSIRQMSKHGGDSAFTDLFIRRPVLAIVVAALIVVAGA